MRDSKYVKLDTVAHADWKIYLKKPMEITVETRGDQVGVHYSPLALSVFAEDETTALASFEKALIEMYEALINEEEIGNSLKTEKLSQRLFALIREVSFA